MYARGWRLSGGKANLKRPLLLDAFSRRSRFQLIPPEGGMSRSDRGDTLKGWRAAQLRRCLRQKQPKRSRGSGLSFARAQRRPKQKQGTATVPPQGRRGQQQTMRRPVPKNQPPQRDPIFRDAKVLLFWCDQQQKEHWLDIPFCCHIGWVFTRACKRSLGICRPLTSNTVWCPVFVISSVENQAAVGTRVTVTAMKLAEPLYQSITSRALLATLTETV